LNPTWAWREIICDDQSATHGYILPYPTNRLEDASLRNGSWMIWV